MTNKKHLHERLCRRLGYQFSDQKLFKKALTHRSATNYHNERLEFLGDAILGMVIAEYLFERFPSADEGQLSRLRSMLVRGKTLAKIAKELEVGDNLHLGEGELKSGGFRRESILADAFEAIIGAIYLDSDFQTVKRITLEIYHDRLQNLSLQMVEKDPKTRLQEWLQSKKMELPLYELLKVTGEAHQQTFEVKCFINEKDLTTLGSGASRRTAEQQAAEKALKLMNVEKR
ncbi:MAG: ribonuclease III [Kangiellaceae bacterium]|nr:ribonuclease III [Kangiellaceae bacterium]